LQYMGLDHRVVYVCLSRFCTSTSPQLILAGESWPHRSSSQIVRILLLDKGNDFCYIISEKFDGRDEGSPLRLTSHMEVSGVARDREVGFLNRLETWAVLVVCIAVC